MDELKKKRIAVVGVSANEEKYGFKIFRDMVQSGYTVYGVNPRGGEVLGRNLFASLRDIVPVPDAVITVVPPAVTEAVVRECAELGIREIWMQPGSESDGAIRAAKEHGIKVTHNACIMVESGMW
jgi:predicted CoA-binding protein